MNKLDNIGELAGFSDILSFSKVFIVLLGIILLGISVRFVSIFGERINKQYPSKRLLIAQLITMASFVIYMFGGAYLFFGVISPPKALIVAVSGTLAVALGLSMKDLIGSVVSGLILIFDKPFQVGDRISFKDMYGEVKTIGLRAVRIITLDDNVITIPNNQFMSEAVASGNFGELNMMIEINFHLDLSSDLYLARNILYETAVTSRFVYLKKPVVIVMSEMSMANRIVMQARVKCYVLDVRFEKAFQTDILLRGSEALIAQGFKRPHIDLIPIHG
jgi:small-conductance mechanosensitive channel